MGLKRVKSLGVSAVAFMVAASSLLFVAQQRSYGADMPTPTPSPVAPAPKAPTPAPSEGATTITSVDNPADITTPAGITPQTPKTVTVHFSNGKQAVRPVEWKEFTNKDWKHTRKGEKITLSGTVADTDKTPSLLITVTAPIPVKQEIRGTLLYATGDKLNTKGPDTIMMIWSDGSSAPAKVVWTGWTEEGSPKVDSDNRLIADYNSYLLKGHLVSDKSVIVTWGFDVLPREKLYGVTDTHAGANPVKKVVKSQKAVAKNAGRKQLANTGAEVSVIALMTIGLLALAGVTGAARLTRKDA